MVVLPLLRAVDVRNCKQRALCFVFEQTTGLVGLAVCESPHEVRAASFPSPQGRLQLCDLVRKAVRMRLFQAPNYDSLRAVLRTTYVGDPMHGLVVKPLFLWTFSVAFSWLPLYECPPLPVSSFHIFPPPYLFCLGAVAPCTV